ncbi:putative LRR receptor-like serine/threonine-protein kinase [Acorus gramineus]|uniref:non-specific serine/threonine protein kinase n=1 Tax=Acorus gramineus TaxID=55184 RepID=A0AAV9B0B3_ACOGR|nr:putative LRR receptor-like serine/threonine-protein kinase [Acorus gramineus]
MLKFAVYLLFPLLFSITEAQPGFISLDCGGVEMHTDDLGLEWTPDDQFIFGQTANISIPGENRKQYMTLRYFPADNRKYCYKLKAKTRTRYLVRASFLYGNFDNSNVYPKFDVSLGATHWSTIVISDVNTTEVRELIVLASSPTISICLSNATTGVPFISTLELRQFNGSIYYTEYESQFFLSVSARINFGAESTDPVRYPDDPFDRIWESDSLKRANYLVNVAYGTEKVSTVSPIFVDTGERPPQKVMQTAVVGRNGSLTYRMNLNGFPGFGWAFSYFAEIKDLPSNETRKFKLLLPGMAEYSKVIVDVQENAQGKYRLYEPGFTNISLPFVVPFAFSRTFDSTQGPILNAMEINKYVQINYGSPDATVMESFVSHFPLADWAEEGGDPCLPAWWSWVQCNSDSQPRIQSIVLSGKNLSGNIPSELTKLTCLVELWLDGNSLTGLIPDFSECTNLKIIHLENNQLNGEVPSSLVDLQNLRELYLQNNLLYGSVPSGLLNNRNLILKFTGNQNLHEGSSRVNLVVRYCVIAVSVILCLGLLLLFYKRREGFCIRKNKLSGADDITNVQPSQKLVSFLTDAAVETTHTFTYTEIEDATGKFERRIGSGGFGVVYYGRLNNGKEIAVKVLTNDSYQGNREFWNEVSLLSRIHHRNLVMFLGCCRDQGKRILVYEFMHNGTLKENLYGPLAQERTISWIQRLEIAEDAAKGIEYLHTGCIPTVIHRDLKSSNILIDKNMRAKLTEKSDIYSFGVILLELISGQEAISNERFGVNCRNIVQWAKSHIDSGNIQEIIDPSLGANFNIESVWKIAEKALMCIQPHGSLRPSISEVVKGIQDAITLERGSNLITIDTPNGASRDSMHSSINVDPLDLAASEPNISFNDNILVPVAR